MDTQYHFTMLHIKHILDKMAAAVSNNLQILDALAKHIVVVSELSNLCFSEKEFIIFGSISKPLLMKHTIIFSVHAAEH